MQLVEGSQLGGGAGDQGGRCVFGKPGGEELFVGVTQALRLVDDEHSLLLGPLEHVGGVDVLGIEGGILAHQDHVQLGQRLIQGLAELKPVLAVIPDAQRMHGGEGFTLLQIEIIHLHVVELVTAALCLQQHRKAGVFLDLDGLNRVHHYAQFNGHC